MQFKCLGGKVVSINLRRKNVCKNNKNVSAGQKNLGCCLTELFPSSNLLEDFIIPNERLSIDFYLPNHSLAFEFNGIQHYEYSKRFHFDRNDFLDQQKRDRRKEDWCQLNNITLIKTQDQNINAQELADLILKAIHRQNESF